MSEKSPYREVGLPKRDAWANPRPKKEPPLPKLFVRAALRRRGRGHEFTPPAKFKKYANQAPCRWCRKPFFAVQDRPCRARRPQRKT